MGVTERYAMRDVLRVAVSARSFHHALRHGQMRLEEVPAVLGDMGFNAVEIDDTYLRASSHFKQRLFNLMMRRYFGAGAFYREYTSARLFKLHQAFQDAGARLAAWTTHVNFSLTGRVTRWQMSYLEGAIATANDFGVRLICLRDSESSAGKSGNPRDAVVESFVEGLSQAAQLASRFRTRLALDCAGGIAGSAERMLQLVQAVNSPHLGVCLDLASDDVAALTPYAFHAYIHATALQAQDAQTGSYYGARLAALRAAGYSGWVVIEFTGENDPRRGIAQVAEGLTLNVER
ncbi:MAG: sugar phosphate isomerase/epimerase [Chloroflexi bacterium]|nr:sugar phosphate isomerase/epimerase [Chloroflexota bacterium]